MTKVCLQFGKSVATMDRGRIFAEQINVLTMVGNNTEDERTFLEKTTYREHSKRRECVSQNLFP